MLLDAQRSLLLVIDLQEKMLPAVSDHGELLQNCEWLIRAAQKIGVPVAAIEQYPKGLGPLVPSIRKLLPPGAVAAKTRFSSVSAKGSRRHNDRDLALARMRQAGVRIVSREMVVFEWLGEANTPLFKSVSKEFLK
jgi:hypothetical protein